MAKELITLKDIENRIYTVRGVQVMFDFDLSEMYEVETKRLNEQVKRNIDRFPEAFRFQVTEPEYENLRSHFATSNRDSVLRSHFATSKNDHGGRRYMPYVFTEQGVAMLSAVLRSETAVRVSIQIMQAFVEMRKVLANYFGVFQRLENIERKQIEADTN